MRFKAWLDAALTRTGASSFGGVDVAVLVVAASLGEFEAAFSKHGYIRPHLLLARFLGARRVVIAVNKMDSNDVLWSRVRYDEIRDEMTPLLQRLGFTLDGRPIDSKEIGRAHV